MKIIIFDNDYQILDEIPFVQNPKPLGLYEVNWQGGGATFANHYVILEDEENFTDLSQTDIFNEMKHQAKISIATKYVEQEIFYLAAGNEASEKQRLNDALTEIDNAADHEQLIMALNKYAGEP